MNKREREEDIGENIYKELLQACEDDDADLVEELLDKVNLINDITPLRIALINGNRNVANVLLNWEGPKGEFFDATANDNEAIYILANNGDDELVQLLLKWEGPNGEHVDPTAGNNKSVRAASENGHTDVLRLLLKWRGPNGKQVDPSAENDAAIRNAAKNDDIATVKILLNWYIQNKKEKEVFDLPLVQNILNETITITMGKNDSELVYKDKCLRGRDIKKILGRGRYGTVRCLDDECRYAVKYMRTNDVRNELKVLKEMTALGIGPKFIDAWECNLDNRIDGSITMIVAEKWDGELSKDTCISKPIWYKLCKEINTLHTHGYVHGDILPKNILVKRKGKEIVDATLSDFGTVNTVDDWKMTDRYGPQGSAISIFYNYHKANGLSDYYTTNKLTLSDVENDPTHLDRDYMWKLWKNCYHEEGGICKQSAGGNRIKRGVRNRYKGGGKTEDLALIADIKREAIVMRDNNLLNEMVYLSQEVIINGSLTQSQRRTLESIRANLYDLRD